MATQLSHQLMSALPQLRWEPTPKRVRALSGGATVLDSRNCRLVWEPKRIVPSYAVPETDIQASLIDTTGTKSDEHPVQLSAGGPPVLDPRTPFAVHTVEGQPLSLNTGVGILDGAGFRPADPDLDAYVLLDFDAFDTWLEEDEPIVGLTARAC